MSILRSLLDRTLNQPQSQLAAPDAALTSGQTRTAVVNTPKQEPTPTKSPESPLEIAAGSSTEIIKVLVVQEDIEAFHSVRHMLPPTHSCDFDFQQAKNFELAAKRLKQENWDIIFVDIDISDESPELTMQKIVLFATAHPVIILTSMTHEHWARKAIREGAQDYIIHDEAVPQLLHRTIWAAIDRFNLHQALKFKTEELSRAFWQKHQFLSTLSHEIKTPMNGIRGGLQLLREDSTTDSQIESIDMIDAAINQLMELIDNLLEHGKAESGHVTIHRSPTSVAKLIDALKCTFHMACEVKGLTLNFEVAADTPQSAELDELRLRQVLSNLIGNAIKFTKSGNITLGIRVTDPQTLQFQVKDNGRGISQDKLQSIFQPYDQGGDCSDAVYKGTGLGLAICKEYVQAMGGDIDVSSQLGEGSVFTFTVKI